MVPPKSDLVLFVIFIKKNVAEFEYVYFKVILLTL